MRKWLIGLAVVIIILLLLPLGFGLHAQHLLKQLNGLHIPVQSSELGEIELTITNIERGWWHSSATINVSYIHPSIYTDQQNNATEPMVKNFLTAKAHIVHGPILWRPDRHANQPFWGQAWFSASVDYVTENLPERFLEVTGIDTGEVLGYVSLFGAQTLYVNTNEISFQDETGQLSFSGFALEIERSFNGKDMVLGLNIPHFNFIVYPPEDEQGGIRWLMNGAELTFAGSMDNPGGLLYGNWLGEAAVKIDTLQVEANGEHYALNKLLSTKTQKLGKDQNVLDGNAVIDIENVSVNQQTFGPIESTMSYADFDRKALENINKMYLPWLFANAKPSFLLSLTPEQDKEFFDNVFTFVNRLPTFEVDTLTIGTENGVILGDLGLHIRLPAKEVRELQTIGFLRKLDIMMDIEVPKILVEKMTIWGLMQVYNFVNPLFSIPQTNPTTPAPNSNEVDYRAEAQTLLNQAEKLEVLKSVGNSYALSILFDDGVISLNQKAHVDLTNKNFKNLLENK